MSMFRELMMANVLPYKELSYLESSRTQYIDTGITLYTDDYFEINANITNYTVSRSYGAAGCSNGANKCCAFTTTYWQNKVYICIARLDGSGNNTGIATRDDDDFHTYLMDNCNAYADGVLKISQESVHYSTENTSYLFACIGRSTSVSMKLKSAKIKQDGVVIREFIPVLWNAGKPYIDGNTGATVTPSAAKPGMFDKVSKRLFVNQGTGADFNYA